MEVDVAGERTEISKLVGEKRPAFVLINDQDLAYAKIRLDANSWQVALENLSGITDSLARTMVWSAAWDTTRDAESSPQDFVHLVLDHIGHETESTTVTTLLRQLVTTSTLYVAAQSREKVTEHIASSLIDLAENAMAGSDNQLQFARFVPQFARTKEQLNWLEEVVSGSRKLSGLEIDADIRWELLIGLATGNRLDATAIDAELARDNTANGKKSAAACLAAISTADAKHTAWKELTEKQEYSNTLINSASLAFGRTLDTELLEPYVAKYMQVAPQIWEQRSYQIASYLLTNLYPVQLANQELAKATQALIDSEFAASRPAFRRILIENLAGLERGLRVQQIDR